MARMPVVRGPFPTATFGGGSGNRMTHKPKTPLLDLLDVPRDKDDVAGADLALAIEPMRVVMRILYAARFARPDLLRACGHLTLYFTKWTEECNWKL